MGYSDVVVPCEITNPAKEDSHDPLLHSTRPSGLFFLSIMHPFIFLLPAKCLNFA
jgi:hypothetical protein